MNGRYSPHIRCNLWCGISTTRLGLLEASENIDNHSSPEGRGELLMNRAKRRRITEMVTDAHVYNVCLVVPAANGLI